MTQETQTALRSDCPLCTQAVPLLTGSISNMLHSRNSGHHSCSASWQHHTARALAVLNRGSTHHWIITVKEVCILHSWATCVFYPESVWHLSQLIHMQRNTCPHNHENSSTKKTCLKPSLVQLTGLTTKGVNHLINVATLFSGFGLTVMLYLLHTCAIWDAVPKSWGSSAFAFLHTMLQTHKKLIKL